MVSTKKRAQRMVCLGSGHLIFMGVGLGVGWGEGGGRGEVAGKRL